MQKIKKININNGALADAVENAAQQYQRFSNQSPPFKRLKAYTTHVIIIVVIQIVVKVELWKMKI